ncbi:tRNA (adenine-N6-)-methyltransferase [Aureococcus anophagefferens]|nr:tRNA (adenine-N6-)-methyltransferase [Aureococcus anophagefferens]
MMAARQPARPLAVVALVFALALVAGARRRRGAPLLGFAETVRVSAATTTMTSRGPLVPFNSSDWRLQKMTHLSSLATLNSTLHLFTTYLAGSLTDCPSDLGCSVRRAKFGVRFGTHSGALQFLAAPLFDDLGEADGWIAYFRELHGDMRNFDAFMHNKVVLYAGPRDVEGVVFELVGAAGDMPRGAGVERGRVPAAHALPFTLAYQSDLVGLADDADDDFALYANEPLLAGAGHDAARVTSAGAAARYEHAAVLTGASHNVTHASATCVVVDMGWESQPASRSASSTTAAPKRSLADYDAYVRRDHEAFLYEDGEQNPDGWDRYLDQHLGIWYSGGEASCQARASALRVLLADVPYAERQQPDAHLFYAGYDGPFALEYQFEHCDADRGRAASAAARATTRAWRNLTGDAWAMGDDRCERLRAWARLVGVVVAAAAPERSVYDGDASRAVSNHLIKILAVYAMSDRPGVTGVATWTWTPWRIGRHPEALGRRPHALHGDHGAETFLGVMLGTTHPKGFRMPFWQTSSNRFYVKARDPYAAKLLGLWMAHRCGFKDQLPLWHVLLAVAEEGSGGSCLRAHYHGKIFESMTYVAAHSYPKGFSAPRGYREDADALLTTCDELVAKCPKLRLCADDVVFSHLHHRTVQGAAPPRKFAYFDSHNISHVIAVPDSLYDPFKLPDGSLAPRGAMRNNRNSSVLAGPDTAAARADADRGWSLASLRAQPPG